MKNRRILLQALLCLVLAFSLTPVVYGRAPVAAGEETSPPPVALTSIEMVEVQLSLQAGWNMVSVPVVPADNSTSAVFPGVAGIFAWNAASRSYYVPAVMEPEKGYWVAVIEDTAITINATPTDSWTTDIRAGWNMIGSVNAAASIADPNDDPDGGVIPPAYWWNPVSKSYALTTDIDPGKGYWVAATEDCLLTLSTSYEIVYYENTQVVTEEEAENIAEVSEGRTEILFEEVTTFVAGIQPGDILACNQSVPGAEYGFLSRVTGVSDEGGVVEVQVEPATLEDAIEQGVIEVTQTIPMQEVMSSARWTTGVDVMQVGARYNFTYSPAEGVTIEGYLLPSTDTDVYIKASIWTGLQEFKFIFSPGLEMGATLMVGKGVSWDKEYTIAEIPGPPIPIWGPLTITPSIELVVGTDGEITGTLETSVTYERVYDIGIRYYNGTWSTISQMRGDGATLNHPSFTGQAEAKVYAGAVLSGTAGVSYVAEAALRTELLGNVRASGEIEAPPWRWQYDLELYLTAQVFADLNLLRIAHVGWESDTWQYPDPPYNLAYGASGRVTTEGGNGLGGVEIKFSGGHSSVTTNADGYWSKHLLRGEVQVTPQKTGYVFDPPSISITGSASDVNFEASETGEGVNLTVINREGEPAEGAEILAYADTSEPPVSRYFPLPATDASGHVFLDIPNGIYTIVAASDTDRFFMVKPDVTSPSALTLYAADETVPVYVTATKLDGSPLQGTIEPGIFPFWPWSAGNTGAPGEVTIYLSPCTYRHVFLWDYSEYYLYHSDVTIAGPQSALAFAVAEMPTGEVIVNLIDFSEGELVPFLREANKTWKAPHIRVYDSDHVVFSEGAYDSWVVLRTTDDQENVWEFTTREREIDVTRHTSVTVHAGGVFTADVQAQALSYEPGERVSIISSITDSFGGKISESEILTDGESEGNYPTLTVGNADGELFLEEQSAELFGEYYFDLPVDAPTGTWMVTLSFDTGPHQGLIEAECQFVVALTENATMTIDGTTVETWMTDIIAGWNTIGSVITGGSIADPNDNPDGSVIPPAYWRDPVTKKYILTRDIEPGKGYWIASVNDWTLTL